jgi:uncharacterized protein YhbP (UPF0306 family)
MSPPEYLISTSDFTVCELANSKFDKRFTFESFVSANVEDINKIEIVIVDISLGKFIVALCLIRKYGGLVKQIP